MKKILMTLLVGIAELMLISSAGAADQKSKRSPASPEEVKKPANAVVCGIGKSINDASGNLNSILIGDTADGVFENRVVDISVAPRSSGYLYEMKAKEVKISAPSILKDDSGYSICVSISKN